MKRIIGLALTLMYLLTSSSLVHASTMGFFTVSDNHTTSHCHGESSPIPEKQSKQNMGCCELFTSNQYSEIKLDFSNSIKLFRNNNIQTTPIYAIHTAPKILFKHPVAFSPGGQTSWGKYHKFSDLVGVIVKVI